MPASQNWAGNGVPATRKHHIKAGTLSVKCMHDRRACVKASGQHSEAPDTTWVLLKF